MKHLDDGPDGLNEEAFDRALGLGKRVTADTKHRRAINGQAKAQRVRHEDAARKRDDASQIEEPMIAHQKRQPIAVVSDVTPSDALDAAEVAVAGIEFETKSLSDGTYYRFTCVCGRHGVWLLRPEVVRKNAERHAQWHVEGEP